MMPFYGSFEHFRAAVESVRAQDNPHWRLVVVDDVYPDLAPGQWLEGLNDSRITYIRNDRNLHTSGNFNKCVSLLENPFGVLMGCDDVMLPGYVGRVFELISEFPQASVIQPGVSVIDEHGNPSRPLADRVKDMYRLPGSGAREYSGEKLAASLLRGNWAYFPSLVWNTAELKTRAFRADLSVVQDLAMLLELIKAGGTFVLDDVVCFNYRRHSASVSAVTGPDGSKFTQELTLFREAAAAANQLGWPKAARAARRHFTSRMNALTELPGAIRARDRASQLALIQHVLAR